MSYNTSLTYPDGFIVGQIVWARRPYDGIYWPGRITFMTNCPNDTVSSNNNLQYHSCSYLIQFFGFNHTNWTLDVLPYHQYRDYLSKNLLVHYDSNPQIKYQFLNAINQADYAHPIRSDNSISKTDYVPTSMTDCHYSLNYHHQYPSNSSSNTQSNYCSCCTHPYLQSTHQLSIETMSNSILPSNNIYHPQITNAVIIVTTKTYSNSSFISYLFNCLVDFIHRSIVYIDDLTNYQHPTASNITYLICLDHFDTTMQQILDRTILNNLNVHMNYLFLVINPPSNEVVTHLYTTVMDKRTILILHYHSTFENDPLLLCSGNRRTFEINELSLLKYLCSKVKYIESTGDDHEELYCISPVSQSNNVTMVDIPNQILDTHSFTNNQNATNEYMLLTSTMKTPKKSGRRRSLNDLSKGIVKRKYKQRLRRHNIISTSSSEYSVQNILENFDSSP